MARRRSRTVLIGLGSAASERSVRLGDGHGRIEPVSLLDFAPPIAALHGVALPDSDGRVIPGLPIASRERAA